MRISINTLVRQSDTHDHVHVMGPASQAPIIHRLVEPLAKRANATWCTPPRCKSEQATGDIRLTLTLPRGRAHAFTQSLQLLAQSPSAGIRG